MIESVMPYEGERAKRLRQYWADVKAGKRPPPERKPRVNWTRLVDAKLDGSFGPDSDKRIILTLHPDGLIELRPERTRRAESIHILDVYRFALRCRVNRVVLEKARAKKAAKAERLATLRSERALRKRVEQD